MFDVFGRTTAALCSAVFGTERSMQRLRATLLIPAFLGFLTSGCGEKPNEGPASAEVRKISVVTTVAPVTSMVESVAGDKIRLTGIIPEGINSHTFEPVPSDV